MLYQLQLVHIFMATYTIIRIQADTFFVSDNKGRDSGKKNLSVKYKTCGNASYKETP